MVDDLSDRHLKGIVTLSDVQQAQKRAIDSTCPITEIATKRVVLLRSDSTVGDAVKVFAGNNPLSVAVDYIPVVADDYVIKGYLDTSEMLARITA